MPPLHGWDRMGWRGGIAERWMRLRDRKSIIAAIATLLAYAGAIGFGLVSLSGYAWPWINTPVIVTPGGWLAYLLAFNLGKIGRASCRERVCQYGSIVGVAGPLKK